MAKTRAALCASEAFLYFTTMLIMAEPVTHAPRSIVLSSRSRDMIQTSSGALGKIRSPRIRSTKNPITKYPIKMTRSRRGAKNFHRPVNTTSAASVPGSPAPAKRRGRRAASRAVGCSAKTAEAFRA
jgi:hypothetical protein